MKNIQIRIEDADKTAAEKVLESLGLDMPTAIRLYMKKIVQTRSIPFSLELPRYEVSEIPVDDEIQVEMNSVVKNWRKHKR